MIFQISIRIFEVLIRKGILRRKVIIKYVV